MKDILQDVVAHTHQLGFLSLVKVTNEEQTKIESMAEDRSVILSATTNKMRLTRLGVAAYLVGVRDLLQAALQLGCDQFGHLLRGGTRPQGAHHHGPEGERRVFVLTQLEIREPTHEHQHHHQVACQRAVVQRPTGQVKTAGGLRLGSGRGVARRFVVHAGLTSQRVLSQRLRVLQPWACQTSVWPLPAAGTA